MATLQATPLVKFTCADHKLALRFNTTTAVGDQMLKINSYSKKC